jgi:hypothetical protein
MNIHQLINRKPEALQFLFLALLTDTYSATGLDTFLEMFQKKISKEEVDKLRMSTLVIVDYNLGEHNKDGVLNLMLSFRGHKGYPGGETSEELKNVDIDINTEVLLYLLITMQKEIESAEKDYRKMLEDSNDY